MTALMCSQLQSSAQRSCAQLLAGELPAGTYIYTYGKGWALAWPVQWTLLTVCIASHKVMSMHLMIKFEDVAWAGAADSADLLCITLVTPGLAGPLR